jgi:tRNA modification GTPase
MNNDDTIVAIATPPGRGGIGVVRFSGTESKRIAGAMLRLNGDLLPRHATMAELIDSSSATAAEGRESATGRLSERLDEVVVTYFQKPHSYTSEDIIEISCHGSPVVLRRAVEIAISNGARLAEPGEFTMRAFLNGRIDLTQAEAVRDLVESRTLFQARVAAQQLEGALANRLRPIKQSLIELIASLEAGIDFADDDVPVQPAHEILPLIAGVRAPLEQLERSFAYGKVVHEGLTLAIVGRPNVGKSSLFNRLVERERAIVTATPGTTRDLVSETVSVGGLPVRLVDTAGIRAASDEAESIGIRKSMEALAEADVVLVVIDWFELAIGQASDKSQDAMQQAAEETNILLARTQGRPRILVFNKSDLQLQFRDLPGGFAFGICRTPSGEEGTRMEKAKDTGGRLQLLVDWLREQTGKEIAVRTSALTGEGVEELRQRIVELAGADAQQEPGFLTNTRHQALVNDSLVGLNRAEAAVHDEVPHEMLLLDLYSALRPLDEISGATTADDILNLIFGRFCIGK